MQVNMTEKNNGYASFGGRGFITTTPGIHLTITKNKEQTMANFGEVASRFYKLGRNKDMGNGLYLHTLMLFHAICHLKQNELSVENAIKKYAELYGTFENSASTSRNCAVLVKLGLVKLAESNKDRRQKDIIFTTLGFKTKSLFNDIPKHAKEAI